MSFQAMAWAIKQPLKCSEKMVLLVLSNYADEIGICWPSQDRLSIDCGMSRYAIMRQLEHLEEYGLIVRQTRYENKKRRTDLYHLNLDFTFNPILHLTLKPSPPIKRS